MDSYRSNFLKIDACILSDLVLNRCIVVKLNCSDLMG